MSKRQIKPQASSGRAGGFGGFGASTLGSSHSSVLSYIQEPPEYSAINDSNAIVAFKNLSKRDGTTKAKALEDLQAIVVNATGELEDGLVEAWFKLFPRLSIDNSRRVRQLTFQLNGLLCAKCGKRIAKHLPQIAGPWLAGEHDADRAVAKTAQDALRTVFTSPEKIDGLRRTFHGPIIEYCKGALLEETPQSLSDERSVSADDAQATYARVVSSTMALISNIMETLPDEDTRKHIAGYEAMLSDKRLWEFASASDSSVRRAMHRFVRVCGHRQPTLIEANLTDVSSAYVYKGLAAEQTGSAVEFSLTLAFLTRSFPAVWTTAYSGKRSAISRLRSCLKHGSHSGPATYWDSFNTVIDGLPDEILPRSFEDCAVLLEAAREGASRKEERMNAGAAWATYLHLLQKLGQDVDADVGKQISENFAVPLIKQFVLPSQETAQWTVAGSKPALLISRIIADKHGTSTIELMWASLVDDLIELAKLSQPEQSKDFEKSQDRVVSSGARLSDLQREFLQRSTTEKSADVIIQSSLRLMRECIGVLESRNGKPYGTAAIIEQQLHSSHEQLMKNGESRTLLLGFLNDSVPRLIGTPSQKHLARCFQALISEPDIETAFEHTLEAALNLEHSDLQARATHTLFSVKLPPEYVEKAQKTSSLQALILKIGTSSSDMESGQIFSDLLRSGVVSSETTSEILSDLTSSLDVKGNEITAKLNSLERLASNNRDVLKGFIARADGPGAKLLPNVLLLEQSSDDDIADRATRLSARLTATIGDTGATTKYAVILQNLVTISAKSMPVETVVELADRLLGEDRTNVDIGGLLPSIEVWRKSLDLVLLKPRPSMRIGSPLGGVVHLVRDPEFLAVREDYDADGMSQALRIAIFVGHVLHEIDVKTEDFPDVFTWIALLSITALAAEDDVDVTGSSGLWTPVEGISIADDLTDFIARANDLQRKYLEDMHRSSETSSAHTVPAHQILARLDEQKGNGASPSVRAYYASLAAVRYSQNTYETSGYSAAQVKSCEELFKSRRSTTNTPALMECIVEHAQPLTGSQVISRACNELVAEITTIDPTTRANRTLEALITFNAIASNYENVVESTATPRLIFLLKHVAEWLTPKIHYTIRSEAYKALTFLLSSIEEMYGEHWAQLLDALLAAWESFGDVRSGHGISESFVLQYNFSLRLYAGLTQLTQRSNVNDDLVEAVKERKDVVFRALTSLLETVSGFSDEDHTPLKVTNELLARLISRLPYHSLDKSGDIYPLMHAQSCSIQDAAFNLLHRHVSETQEQISFDAAIDNKTARLADELISLIIDVPSSDDFATATTSRELPTSLRRYLLSWRLVFDHFSKSSYRVKSDYVEQLKGENVLPGLLSIIFEHLGHARGQPIDASRFNVQIYDAGTEPSAEKDLQWLLSHLFYLSMLHLPGLVQTHVRDVRSRQTSAAIETWTAKFISPSIIAASLEDVASWTQTSVKEDPEYENMTVRVGMRSREINVGYLVDEQTMAIKVVLPETYPLDSAKVESVNRVAVKEEKWQSWLRNCQGVIVFSNGSIVDGLSAWRKNVVGALKGQTECAICYSIISAEKQLPTKRCRTCKNLFHSSCLYKWFKTSNASTCPLCRNPFEFN